MKFCIYLLIASLLCVSMTQCGAVRTNATRIQTARTRRLDELTE